MSSPGAAYVSPQLWSEDFDFDSFSDDEIVYLTTPLVFSSPGSPRSDDFVLVPRASSPRSARSRSFSLTSVPSSTGSTNAEQQLSDALASLSLNRAPQQPIHYHIPLPRPAAVARPTTPASHPQKQKSRAPTSPKRRKPRTGASPAVTRPSAAYPSPPASPAQPKKKKQQPSRPATGLGQRAVVDDVSELGDAADTPAYAAARAYIASYLANPPKAGNNGTALLLLQALIIELGLYRTVPTPSATTPTSTSSTTRSPPSSFSLPDLPHSLRQAKQLLKTRAFINIRDYLAVRGQGQEALQRAMHPSRGSLVKEIRKGKRAPLAWVKQTGLNVLLVDTH